MRRLAVCIPFSFLVAASSIRAIELRRAVMPGALAQDHADIETQCGKCHQPFERGAQKTLCLECHHETNADVRAHEGFHGRSPAVASQECKTCHPEHRGRDAELASFDPLTFHHELTDFPLEGAHLGLACGACHPEGVKRREASSTCIGCHRDVDPHRGQMGERCGDCHAERTWEEAKFDHASTHFPLEGKHRKVGCARCHAGERYKETPDTCAACHNLDDAHRGRFGSKCAGCHNPRGWKDTSFDHDRDTKFPLRGAHRTACRACHRGTAKAVKAPTDCYGCHANDDEHRGGNGRACDRCHRAVSWSAVKFDHDRDTDFSLRGAHREVGCTRCHADDPYQEKLSRECYSCHRSDDAHRGQQGKDCGHCHREQGWTQDVFFDHELTRFPLLGLHAVASCEACHADRRFKDAPSSCVSCHAKADSHEGRLGPSCELCHNPNGWKIWTFDHDRQTDFALRGAHEQLACRACHHQPVHDEIQLPSFCRSCHAAEDVHRGDFGRDCSVCHEEDSWREIHVAR